MPTANSELQTENVKRCAWAGNDPLYIKYHDEEWGKPIHDDKKLFEFLVLESAQAGLSWITILRRREGYRKAFADFDVAESGSIYRRGRRTANAGRKHYPQPRQNYLCHQQCKAFYWHTKGVWLV